MFADLQEKLQSVPNSLPYFATWVSMIGTPDCQLMASAGYSVARKLTRLPISSDNMSATICMICLGKVGRCEGKCERGGEGKRRGDMREGERSIGKGKEEIVTFFTCCLVQGQHCALWRRSGLSTSCCCL